MTVLYSLGNGLGRSLWGFLYDYFGFRRLFMIVFSIEIVISGLIYFIIKVNWLFFILFVTCGLLLAGAFSLIPSICTKIFGVK